MTAFLTFLDALKDATFDLELKLKGNWVLAMTLAVLGVAALVALFRALEWAFA